MKSERNTSFWVTYSDLATGLMLVFLLIMVVMMFQLMRQQVAAKNQEDQARRQQESFENNREAVEQILNELTIILGTKTELAKRLERLENTALQPTVDPLTARIQLRQDSINFDSGETAFSSLSRETQDNVLDFGAQYICALWKSERADAAQAYIDPTGSKAIQNIKIMGTADLQGSSDLGTNPYVTAARAQSVQVALLEHLEKCSKSNSCYKHNTECEGQDMAIWRYAQERLIAVGLSHSEHCTEQKDALKGDCANASSKVPSKDIASADHRRVDFSAEITNSDLSSLLIDMYRLSSSIKSMGDPKQESASFTNIRGQVQRAALACSRPESQGRSSAQVCDALRRECLNPNTTLDEESDFKCTEILNASSNP